MLAPMMTLWSVSNLVEIEESLGEIYMAIANARTSESGHVSDIHAMFSG